MILHVNEKKEPNIKTIKNIRIIHPLGIFKGSGLKDITEENLLRARFSSSIA
jgi:hypothetical protein